MSMYALQVMTGMEAEITQKLRGKGVDARCPQERRMIRRGGKWQEQLYPLFPSYIFVSTPDVYRVYYAVRHEDGVLHWLGATKGTPEALSAHEEANILWLAGDGPLPPSEAEMQADGTLDINKMLDAVDKNTILVACMMVNNEVGTRNDVERLAAEVKRRNSRTIVHVDAVQAWMRVPIKLANIDTLAVSGHKIHAPKGIGALYLSDSLYQAFQAPYLGGEQEREKRPGTENLPYALGLAAAATRLNKTMKSRDAAVRALNLRLREGLKAFPEVVINSPENAVPEVLNFSEMCIKSETMLAHLAQQQVYVSSASACGRGQPSHTLAAMGRDPLAIDTAIRVSFCADNTPEDVDAFLNAFEDGAVVDQAALVEAGIIKSACDGVKVLSNGALTKKVTVKANAFSEAAKAKIEAAGGKAEVI